MRIINRQEFLTLPEGTVFSEYEPCAFTGLFIKIGDCLLDDYFELPLVGNVKCRGSEGFIEILEQARKSGEGFDLDFDGGERNGCFEDEQLYAVYDRQDIQQLIERLKECLQ